MSSPLVLVTGTPGAGKSLWAMKEAEAVHQQTNRAVYYYNIPGVTLDHWTEIDDPTNWNDLPDGSIIVMDEAHEVFPQRVKGDPPQHVKDFARARHSGYTILLITQRPNDIDIFVRERIGRHVHFERHFGLERSRGFEAAHVFDPKDHFARKKALGFEFRYPKEVYGWYKSADMHTVQKKVPWAKLALIIIPLLLVPVFGYFGFQAFQGDYVEEPEKAESEKEPETLEELIAQQQPTAPELTELEALAWAIRLKERIEGNPHSARFYDAVFEPVTMPKIAGCGEIKSSTTYRCWCNTQQGTIIDTMTIKDCQHYLKFGWFDPTKPDQEESGGGEQPKDQQHASDKPGINPFEEKGTAAQSG